MINKIYHEKQCGNYCRLHAINNLLGEQICSVQIFDKYCDEFDKNNKFEKNTTKKQIFYNNGGNDNIFGFVLNKTIKEPTTMEHYDFHKRKTIKALPNTMGYLLYSKNHAFCIRKIDDQFYLIDSLRAKPTLIEPHTFCNKQQLGVIHITKKLND
jgi:hypothetical protein